MTSALVRGLARALVRLPDWDVLRAEGVARVALPEREIVLDALYRAQRLQVGIRLLIPKSEWPNERISHRAIRAARGTRKSA